MNKAPISAADRDWEHQLREVNEALLVSSVRQHELTERAEHAQVALRESNARFEALFDASPIGMYLVDSAMRIQFVSRSARTVFGDVPDLLGSDFIEVMHILWPSAAADEIVARFRHTQRTGEPYIFTEFSEVRRDRHVREYYDWQIHRIALPDGQSGVVCYFMDASTRVRAVAALRESEVRYRRLFQTAKDGILILDATTGKILDANAFMAALVGREPHDLHGKELFEIGMFADENENRAAFRGLQQSLYLRHDHLPVRHKDGSRVEVEFIANIYREGDALVAQCNVRNISQRVAMEKQIAEQAEALADESRRKDEFLAMLSHELRNPLAPIRSALYLLKLQEHPEGENPIQKQAREIIERQSGNLAKLVSDLMEVSRVINGQIRLHPQVVDLNQIVAHAIETTRPLVEQHNHSIAWNAHGEPVWVSVDGTRMEEVFINLLNNAAKYTLDSGRIEISCEQPKDTNYAEVRVRDNGVGIEPRLLKAGRIFDLFTQADRSLDRAQGGLGIGLALAHRLVQMHGGSLEAFSPPDGSDTGSEFIVRMALAPAPPNAQQPQVSSTLTPNAEDTRVLIVDDNVDLVVVLTRILQQKGYFVQNAASGTDGLALATQWRPNIILLDIGLPGIDGYEVAKRLRAAGELPRPQLIAVTGYGRDTDIALSREAGFDGHLTKPYDVDELVTLMATLAT